MNRKRIVLLSALLFQSLWLVAQTTLVVGDGESYTINSSVTYTSVTVTGGSLTISSGAIVSMGTLTISGSATRTGVCTVKEPGTSLTVSLQLDMNTLNTNLVVSNNAQMTFGSHSFSATSPYACNIAVNSNAILHSPGYGATLGSNTSLKFANADGDLGDINLGAGAVFEVSGSASDVVCGGIYISNAAEARVISAAKVTASSVSLSANNSAIFKLATGGKLYVESFSATAGKLISDASSIIYLKSRFDNYVSTGLYPSGSLVNIELDASGSSQVISGDNKFARLKLPATGTGTLSLNASGASTSNTEITSQLDIEGSKVIVLAGALTVSNPSATALSRTGLAYVYVDHTDAVFMRYTNTTNEYLFPVGTSERYGPAYIKPSSTNAGAYSVKFKSGTPSIGITNIGGSIIPIAGTNKKRVNNLFYHEIKDKSSGLNSPPAAIYISYDPVADASDFDAVAQYQEGAWQVLAEPVSRPSEGSLAFAGCTPHTITASNMVYILANSISASVPPSYVSLKKKLDGGYYTLTNNKLYFLFEEEYAVSSASLNYRVLDGKNSAQTGLSSLSMVQGINKFELNVGSLLAGYYVLEVSNSKSEKWYLRFKK